MREHGMSVRQSGMVQGLAVLLMIYHHLFNAPGALGISYYSLLGEEAELRLAWFGKICVCLYAFVTGYGVCRVSMKEKKRSIGEALKKDYAAALKRIFRFYTVYWFVTLIYIAAEHILFGRNFALAELVPNLLGIMDTYNGSWWYALEYAKLCLVLPLADLLFTRLTDPEQERVKNIAAAVIIAALAVQYILGRTVSRSISDPIFAVLAFLMRDYLRCCLMGFLIARFDIYEKAAGIIPKKAELFAGIALMVLAGAVRIIITKDVSETGRDFILAPVFIFGFCLVTQKAEALARIFAFFGRYSTYMWLIHLFFLDGFFKMIVCATHLSTGIFLTLTALSLGGAVLLKKGYEALRSLVRGRKRRQKAA